MQAYTSFILDRFYTRAQIRAAVGNPGRGGAWDTGYLEYGSEFFVFATVGVPGRTGHDYDNFWSGERLHWEAKGPSKLADPQIRKLISGRYPVHLFVRDNDLGAFRYKGLGKASEATSTTPVKVVWSVDGDFRPTLDRDQVAAELQRIGFKLDPVKVKSRRATLKGLTVYVKQESGSFVLVIPPSFEPRLNELRAIPGVRRPMGSGQYVHNQSFRDFPTRVHTGTTPRPFGLDFDFDTGEALEDFVVRLSHTASPPEPLPTGKEGGLDPRTETEVTRAARLGQDRFRRDLMDRWDRRCALTGLALPDLLRASHIKPWCDSSATERLDPHNGLLLALHVDGLFDRGLITFEDDGTLTPSSTLDPEVLERLGLLGLRVDGLSNENRSYLAVHRTTYFKSGTAAVAG